MSQQDEIERTYDVGTQSLPTLTDVDEVSRVGQPVEMALVAVYFDTPGLDLARHGITLRRRTGGDDAGWHLKLPVDADTRTEVRLPPGRSRTTVPRELVSPVRALVRDRPLSPVARLETRRLQYDLVGAGDVVLARLCDDEVRAERLHGAARVEDWREWEVELVDGSRHLLDTVEKRLLAGGASPAASRSKLRRALGDALPRTTPRAPSRKQLSRGSGAQLVVAHLAEHTQELLKQDARLRSDLPGSVHKLRIAARRLRSALKTYRPVLAPDSADAVGDELRWLGQVLSGARDAQVLRERLRLLVAAEPVELVMGPVAQRIDDDLSAAYQAGRERALAALDSKRYFRLMDALDDLVQHPPFTPGSEEPARDLLPRLLERDARRLRRAVRGIRHAGDAHEHDLALHEARKKAKRLRYAAESAVPVLPARAQKLATSAKRVQEALGDHQDAVVARDRLRAYGAQSHLGGQNGFSFGRLHALEQARADDAERTFWRAWKRLPRRRLRRWLRG